MIKNKQDFIHINSYIRVLVIAYLVKMKALHFSGQLKRKRMIKHYEEIRARHLRKRLMSQEIFYEKNYDVISVD